MKTFEQFLSEAGAPSQEETAIRRFFERGGRGTSKQGRIAKENEQNARKAADAERAAKGLPSGTSASLAKQDLARQLAAQKAEARSSSARRKPPSQLIEPKQLEMRFMRTDKPHIPLSLDGRLIPKTPKLPKPSKKSKQLKPKTRQLRIPKT